MGNDDAMVGRILTRREILEKTAVSGLGFAAFGGLSAIGSAQK